MLSAIGYSVMIVSPFAGVPSVAIVQRSWLIFGTAVSGALLYILGARWFSAPPPDHTVLPYSLWGRTGARGGANGFATFLGLLVLNTSLPDLFPPLLIVTGLGCPMAAIASLELQLFYAREWANRIPAYRLADWIERSQAGLIIGPLVLLFTICVISDVAILATVACSFVLICLSGYAVVMLLLWQELRKQVRIARTLEKAD
jgi:hypothetical protein